MRDRFQVVVVLLVAAVLTGCASPAAEEGPSEQEAASSAGSVTSAPPTGRDLLPLPPHLELDADDVTVTFERVSYEWVDLEPDGTLTDRVRSKEAAAAAGPCTPGATVSSPGVLKFDVIRAAGDDLSLRAIRQDAGEAVQDLDVVDGTVPFDLPAGDWLLEADGRWRPEGSGGYRACVTVLDAGDGERARMESPPDAWLLIGDFSIRFPSFASCWESHGSRVCGAAERADARPPPVAPATMPVQVVFDGPWPDELYLEVKPWAEGATSHPTTVQDGQIVGDLGPGVWTIRADATWAEGGASYDATIELR